MKIYLSRIPPEGLILEEKISARELDLDTDTVKFDNPVSVRALVTMVTNAVTVRLALDAHMRISCSRCLNEFDVKIHKDLDLNYCAEKTQQAIDLNPDIREEIIMDYSMNPLCRPDCKGLCPKCGKNKNEGGCNCAVT